MEAICDRRVIQHRVVRNYTGEITIMKHLKETNQTYFQHMRMALSNLPNAIFFIIYSSLMIPVMVIHAVAPFLFSGSIGTWLDYLHEKT